MNLSNYKSEVIVSSSRLVQESIKIEQGASVYGALAAFLDSNLDNIDYIAEQFAGWAAQKAVKSKYDKQFFDDKHKVKSVFTHNIYLNKDKKEKMEEERRITGMTVEIVTGSVIKLGSRGILKLLSDKDKYLTCKQVYSVLVSYIQNAEKNANVERASLELNKIRNSFPINASGKKKLIEECSLENNSLDTLDVSSIVLPHNETLRDALAFFLTAVHRQLYGEEEPDMKTLLNYFSLIDLNGVYGKEILNENQYSYDSIVSEQLAYLQLSRAMVKSISIGIPNIDIERIQNHSAEMAQYDPYAIRRKKIKGTAGGVLKTIAGIFAKEPELAFNGVSTALSQFDEDEQLLESAKKKFSEWGISSREESIIFTNSKNIKKKCNENDITQST